MNQKSRAFAVTAALLAASFAAAPSVAQRQGGILKIYMLDSPASMSIHEEATVVAERPVMGVFNNLVMFDQHVQQNSLGSIISDLAIGWSWNEDGTDLTFPLREGVKWHDGRPFTAKDVKCTWDLLTGKSSEKFRVNPRKSWYRNLEEVTTNGDYEVTFRLKRPQPAFLALLASLYGAPSDRHRPVQIRRLQAERIYQGDAQSGLLEEGPTLSRRHRVHGYTQSIDDYIGLHRRQLRPDIRRQRH